jgi:hypothetical protein
VSIGEPVHDHEVVQMAVFKLSESANRLQRLATAARSRALRLKLMAVSRQLRAEERLIGAVMLSVRATPDRVARSKTSTLPR